MKREYDEVEQVPEREEIEVKEVFAECGSGAFKVVVIGTVAAGAALLRQSL